MFKKVLFTLIVSLLLTSVNSYSKESKTDLPDTTKGFDIPEQGYLVKKLKNKVYMVTNGVYQMLFAVTGEGVIVVDAPPNIGENILKAIAEITTEPVKYVIYSHSHIDHIGSAGLFPKDATYIAHKKTAKKLIKAKDPNRPLPSVTFSDNYILRLGNQRVELSYKGENHEAGNIFVYFPEEKILMLVDIVYPGWVPFKNLAVSTDIRGFINAHDQILEYDFNIYVGGHVTRLGNKKDVQIAKEYVMDLKQNAAKAFEIVDFNLIAQKTGYDNKWLLFDAYMNAVTESCSKAVKGKWVGKLGGAEVFTDDHCWTMQQHLNLNGF